MSTDHLALQTGDERRVVVVGSGPCGAMAARELVAAGIPVVLLESGRRLPRGLLVRAGGRNLYRRVPDRGMERGARHVAGGDAETAWFYQLAPGGLSNQWTGAVPRFAPEDFTDGERLHARYRWPLDYDDLAPYYERVERLLRITAAAQDAPHLPAGWADYRHEMPDDWQPVAEAARARGQGLTVLPLADGPPWLMARRGTAFNSYATLVRPLLGSPHFQLVTGAHALRLEWCGAKRRVTGVVYHDQAAGCERRLAAEAVVVAAGTLDSTRLLFSSACADFPHGLGNCEGLVGRYLHDHPKEWWVFDLDRPLTPACPSLCLTRAPYAQSPPLMAASWTFGTACTADKLRSFLPFKSHAASVQIFGTMVPEEAARAEPDGAATDVFGLPTLRLTIRYDEETLCNVARARARVLEILEAAGHRAAPRAIVPQLHPGQSVHYGGTARMHASRQYGVLDPWNRVFDAPNVVVADASCFTTGPEKNPTLTAMALAARAADRLARDLRAG